jgi:hypothetical protein
VLNAYILIQSDMGGAAVVAESVRAVPGVLETEIVTGCYDVVARAQAHDMDELATRVTPQIQALRGVMRTVTCIIVQPPVYFHDREAARRHGRSDSTRRIANGPTRRTRRGAPMARYHSCFPNGYRQVKWLVGGDTRDRQEPEPGYCGTRLLG